MFFKKKKKKDNPKYKITSKGQLYLAICNYGKDLGYDIDTDLGGDVTWNAIKAVEQSLKEQVNKNV